MRGLCPRLAITDDDAILPCILIILLTASEKPVQSRHLGHERHQCVTTLRAHNGKWTIAAQHGEWIREQGIHHVIHLAHMPHMRSTKTNSGC